MKIRKPTEQEMSDYIIYDLTSGVPWDPSLYENDDSSDEEPDTRNINATTTKPAEPDWDHIQRCLGWKPLDVIKRTLQATTQHAQNVVRLPMRMHYKSRFPALNVKRLREVFATDTFFSSEKALGGYTCAQIYVGKTSTFTVIYGMKSENQMVETFQDFIRQYGAPTGLFSDNAKSKTGKAIKDIQRHYAIKDLQSEARHQHQNYAERRIQEVKATSNIIMDRVNAPMHVWLLCLQYVAQLLNNLATPSLGHRTPYEKAFGTTPDISNLLQFYFYQPFFYLDTNDPSYINSKEQYGHWVGIAENVGDALTFKILTPDFQIICRSTLCPAYHPLHYNLRQGEGEESGTQVDQTTFTAPTVNPIQTKLTPNNNVRYQFIKEHNNFPHKAKVIEALDNGTKYLVEIGDGDREEVLTYNEIVNMTESQLQDNEEDQIWSFEEVMDHRKGRNGKYEVLIKWTTGEETWEPLTWIADQDPVTLAKYAKEHDLLNETGWKHFQRLIKHEKQFIRTLRRAKATKTKGTKIKFGVEVPRNYNDALRIDKENGNTLWQEAIKTELDQINKYKTFKVHGKAIPPPKGYKRINVHFVFDVKFDLRRKARLVAGGHLTDPIYHDSPYTGIASIKSIRTCLFLGELNGLELCAADVGNAYLEALTKEKLYIIAGPEFGELEGYILIVHKALYGLRTSGARWAEKLADSLRAMNFFPSYADPAIWMQNCNDHYEYICVWVNDMLIISKDTKSIIKVLEKEYILKGVGFPEYYLGADMKKTEKPENVFIMGSYTYVKRCLSIYEQLFGQPPPKGIHTPLDPKDHPELDTSDMLDNYGMHLYWKLLGILQWAVTLGRIDIMCAVMTMGGFRCEPRIGHLERLKRIFGFLRNYKNCSIKFRTEMPDYSIYPTEKYDWTYVYGKVEEELPPNMPKPKGKKVIISVFADANLYHDHVSGRAVSGILMMLNKTPIDWYSKRQATVETATYGSEFISARIATDKIIETRYMLRMLGVPMEGPSYMFGDNLAVVNSASIPDDTLKKRHNALCYHRVREAIAADIVKFIHIEGKDNPADVLTKFLPSTKWWPLMKPLLHWLSGD